MFLKFGDDLFILNLKKGNLDSLSKIAKMENCYAIFSKFMSVFREDRTAFVYPPTNSSIFE